MSTNLEPITWDVLIQGGGPVGLACAAWCLQQLPTLKLVLVDRNPSSDEALDNGEKRSDTRGIALSHGSKLLLETIHAWPTNCPEIHRVHVSQAGRFGRAIMTREELHQDALGHIARYRDIHLALRQALRKLQSSSPHFSWVHSNENPDLASQIELAKSACIVHAEGGLFNQQEWIEAGRSYDQTALVGLVEVNKPQAHQAWERFTTEGPLALLPSHAGERFLNLVWCSAPSTAQHRLELTEPDFLAALQHQFGSRLGQFISVRERRIYELGLNYRKEVAVGNAVWIGNAAQTLHPVAGQGLNLGLRDAYLLAEKLAWFFSRPAPLDSANSLNSVLQDYARTRNADRKTTIGITDFLARVFTSHFLPVVFTRGLALSALQWLPPLKTSLARQMMFGRR